MMKPIVDPAFLFDFSIELLRIETATPAKKKTTGASKGKTSIGQDWELDDGYRLPCFAQLNGEQSTSAVFAAWSESGLYFQANVFGKAKPPQFLRLTGGYSDGLRVWIDTRCSPGIHRATRFCHCFHFFPGGEAAASAGGMLQPHGILDEIPRTREMPGPVDPKDLEVRSELRRDGYRLWAHVPERCLTGYSPVEFDRIRLYYDVVDLELGTRGMVVGPELRYAENPSIWVQASLVSTTPSKRR